ncbi:hypothetical protein CDN99_00075 [Roseateles aquatilis]|uniref:GtrA/DPMS transmembrane domain-containing protein n=1 Tax=Roseateles aquatilis TaxID=431061 RepID=A0A246JJX4_9BURK|nr:GtrA family protein [Roseateles aquatilis]OWQ92948.1 hypothetical protein CDN99_00075 [Roseateles aquatilis]
MADSPSPTPHEAPAARQAWHALSLGRFGRFVLVGGAATAVHYLVALLLLHLAGWGAVAASAGGAFVGAIASYVLNARFTFGVRGRHGHHAPRFAAVASLGWMLNALGMWGLLRLGLHPYVAQPIVTALVLLSNFGFNALWAMRPDDGR